MENIVLTINILLEIEETNKKMILDSEIEAEKIIESAKNDVKRIKDSKNSIFVKRIDDIIAKEKKRASEKINRMEKNYDYETNKLLRKFADNKDKMKNLIISKIMPELNK